MDYFELFRQRLREEGVSEDHIIGVALDDKVNAILRNADALCAYILDRIGTDGEYYVLLDEVQYATASEL